MWVDDVSMIHTIFSRFVYLSARFTLFHRNIRAMHIPIYTHILHEFQQLYFKEMLYGLRFSYQKYAIEHKTIFGIQSVKKQRLS